MSSAPSCCGTRRLRRRGWPLVLGLTGSIGMGKSTAARMFRDLGVPVHDADAAVHALLAKGGEAVPEIAATFPDVVVDGTVDRKKLGQKVFGDGAALKRLEAILHPKVRRQARDFIRRQRHRRAPLVVLDIPLLFETGGDRLCDAVVVVTAPRFVQEARVLRRPGMDRSRLQQIRAQQLPDREKRRRADFVVETGLGRLRTLRRLTQIVKMLRSEASQHA